MRDATPHHVSRYVRQEALPGVGVEGQRRLATGHVAIVGLGALGCAAADLLARAGVGRLTLNDRDVVEWTNLQRQTLYSERDAQMGLPKAEAAASRIAQINSTIACTPLVADVTSDTIEKLLGLSDSSSPRSLHAILDATDNLETRFLLNDVSVKHRVPLVYGGVLATRGMHATFIPGVGPCLRCTFGSPGEPASAPTCETAGVLGSAVAAVAGAQATDALKLLLARPDLVHRTLTEFDVWSGFHRVIALGDTDPGCPCCALRRFDFLNAPASDSATLCGQDAVQVRPAAAATVNLDALASRLNAIGTVERTRFMVRFTPTESTGISLSVFSDGRAIVRGTMKSEVARGVYARYIGA